MSVLRALLSVFFATSVFFDVACGQTLDAVPKGHHLRRRGLNLEPRFEGNHLYYSDVFSDNAKRAPTTAQVSLNPKLPTLVLEDVEDHIHHVICTKETISIVFHSSEQLQHASSVWSKHEKFIIVVSQTACAAPGRHEPIIVSNRQISSKHLTVTFAAERQEFKKCTHSMGVEIGSHHHDAIHKRQLDRRYPLPQSSVATPTASGFPTFTFPSQSASTSPTATSVTGDVSFSFKDTTLLPPSPEIAEALTFVPTINGIKVDCIECSMTGSVELSAGNFTVVPNETLDTVQSFFDQGTIEFKAQGISATMNFRFTISPGFTVTDFVPSLPDIPITPFLIPDVAAIGPIFQPTFPTGIKFNSPVSLLTGFKLQVPDDSTLILDVGDPGSSTTRGFSDTTFDALPLDVSAPNLNLELFTSFRPKLILGATAEAIPNQVNLTGGVGAFLDLPYLNGTIKTVSGVDDHCNPGGNMNGLVNFLPSVMFDAGVLWELSASLPGPDITKEGDYPLIGTSMPLPTYCYTFDDGKDGGQIGLKGANPDTPTSSAATLAKIGLTVMISIVSGMALIFD